MHSIAAPNAIHRDAPRIGVIVSPAHAVDLNLLIALDALLAEGSVAGAARRLGLSASAMSQVA